MNGEPWLDQSVDGGYDERKKTYRSFNAAAAVATSADLCESMLVGDAYLCRGPRQRG